MPLNSRGRSRVLAFGPTNDDIDFVRHLTSTASCVRLISRRSSAARSIKSTTTSPSGWTHCGNSASLGAPIRSFSFSRCVPMCALRAHWRVRGGTVWPCPVNRALGQCRFIPRQHPPRCSAANWRRGRVEDRRGSLGRAASLRFLSPLIGRVGVWRAGVGRSLCSLLPRPFVCECHTISTVPRFQSPPRRTQHADFLALRSPVCFAPRLMRPIMPERLSAAAAGPCSR